ncbi:GDP-mannose 4,6-dehydratase [soil metagenome]
MAINWVGKKVLVTGANGFLASWIVKKLIEKKANITSLVYEQIPFSMFDLDGFKKLTKVIHGDILDFPMLQKLIQEQEIEMVFHVGAQAINKTAISSPYKTLETNIRGTYNLLEAIRLVSPSTKIIVASSDKAYGIHNTMPYKETFSLHGEYPYEVSKSCADLISSAYFNTYKLPICIVRSGNIYGEGDWHFSRVVPSTIIRIHKDLPPLLISETERDYVYAEDVANGYLKLGEAMLDGLKGEAFNFGRGKPVKTSVLLKTILEVMDKNSLGIVKSDEKRMEIPVQYLSIEKAKKMIGFAAPTELKKGLENTVKWYITHIDKVLESKLED